MLPQKYVEILITYIPDSMFKNRLKKVTVKSIADDTALMVTTKDPAKSKLYKQKIPRALYLNGKTVPLENKI